MPRRRVIRSRAVDAPMSPQQSAVSLVSFIVLLFFVLALLEVFGQEPSTRLSTASLLLECVGVSVPAWYIDMVLRKSRPPHLIGELLVVVAMVAWGVATVLYSRSHAASLRPLTDGLGCMLGLIVVDVVGYLRRKRNRARNGEPPESAP